MIIKYYIKEKLAELKHQLKVRWYAQRFDIFNEVVDPKAKNDALLCGDWISYDKKLYYGHPWFLFFESSHNVWWQKGKSLFKINPDRPPSDDLQKGESDPEIPHNF